MLAQKRNKIMYKNMFSNFFKFPIGHLTHPSTYKVFLDFWIFIYLHGPLFDAVPACVDFLGISIQHFIIYLSVCLSMVRPDVCVCECICIIMRDLCFMRFKYVLNI